MTYHQDITGCLAENCECGLSAAELEDALRRTVPALPILSRKRDDDSLPLLRLPARRDDIARLKPLAAEFARFKDVIVLGTGGSSLGGQTLVAVAPPGRTRIHFMDNVDPHSFTLLFDALDPRRTGLIAISKSGGTAETLVQFFACMAWLDKRSAARTIVITEPKPSPLRGLATARKLRVLDHDPNIGGRYSVLSNVGLLPAMIAGIDVAALRRGAREVLDATLAAANPRDAAPALGAAVSVALNERHGITATVVMPYVDRLAHFGFWFRQLWAESLGKDGKGTTPIRAVGTVDQHSQLQLYLDGPADKMFSLVMLAQAGKGPRMPAKLSDPSLGYLAGKRMGDLIDAEQRATAQTLIRNGRPTRVFALERLDARALGALLMHYMLETMIAAQLWGVNAFDQPAVEQGKVLARQYLGEKGRAKAQ
ncbi:MAG: glucose-6-phosphate isomerase [Alphaproteobacteria bacterium]|nr:glucose-6-phosphate isomerase [Alphaproteobacteria bacterium]